MNTYITIALLVLGISLIITFGNTFLEMGRRK
jgi:hypothetical protein